MNAENDIRTVREYGVTNQIAAELRRDIADGLLESMFTEQFERHAAQEGYIVHQNPTHEWVDLDAPENSFTRQMMTWTDEETGETFEPPRWFVRSIGLVVAGSAEVEARFQADRAALESEETQTP